MPSSDPEPISAKQLRRRRISQAATALFLTNGFDAVAIADIAAAAGVSKMTVTNHFPLKEDLVFDEFDDELARIGAALDGAGTLDAAIDAVARYCADRERDSPVTRALRGEWMRDSWPRFATMVAGSRVLNGRFHAHYLDVRDTVAAHLPSSVRGTQREIAAWLIAETVHLIDWWPFDAVQRGLATSRIESGRTRIRREAVAALRHGLSR